MREVVAELQPSCPEEVGIVVAGRNRQGEHKLAEVGGDLACISQIRLSRFPSEAELGAGKPSATGELPPGRAAVALASKAVQPQQPRSLQGVQVVTLENAGHNVRRARHLRNPGMKRCSLHVSRASCGFAAGSRG